MKEPMCTHLAKRGSRYYFRRKIPLDLIPHYNRREVMRSLGTSNRKEAERLARIAGVELDHEFDEIRTRLFSVDEKGHAGYDSHAATIQSDPVDLTIASLSLLASDIVRRYEHGSPTPIAYFTKIHLRESRSEAAKLGKLSEFMERCKAENDFHQAVLRGSEKAIWQLNQHEGVRNGLLAFLTGEGSMGITAAWVARQSLEKGATAPLGKTTFPAIIEKWAAGINPAQNTVSRTKMHLGRFEDFAGIKYVEEVTRQHGLRFIEKLKNDGQTPQNINMHLASLIKLLNYANRLGIIETNTASGLAVKDPHRPRIDSNQAEVV